MRKVKRYVLVYANYDAPYEGNFFSSQEKLSKALSERCIGTIFLLPPNTKVFDWTLRLNTEFSTVIFQKNTRVTRIKHLIDLFNKYNLIFVHTHFVPCEQILEIKIAKSISRRPNLKIVEHYHNHYKSNKNFFVKKIKEIIIKNDYIIGCSNDVQKDLVDSGVKNISKSLENAIDFSRLDIYDRNFNFLIKDFKIMILGFDFSRKGVDIAINACKNLILEGYKIQLMICLSTNERNVKENIEKICGYIPTWITILPSRNDIATYYRNIDLFISPSREEGFCYAIIEAAYCGKISIATNISGQRKNNMKGIVWCEPEDVESLKKSIVYVMNLSDEMKHQIEIELHEMALKNYFVNKWIHEQIKIYEEWNII